MCMRVGRYTPERGWGVAGNKPDRPCPMKGARWGLTGVCGGTGFTEGLHLASPTSNS